MITDTAVQSCQSHFSSTDLWKPWMVEYRLRQITSLEELEEFIRDHEGKDLVSWDIETSALDPDPSKIVGHSLSFDGHESVYIPVGHKVDVEENLDPKDVWDIILPIFQPPRILLVYNWRFEGEFLRRSGVRRTSSSKHLRDVMIYVWLHDPNRKKVNLKDATTDFLQQQMLEIHEVPGCLSRQGKVKTIDFSRTRPSEATLYAAADPLFTFQLYNKLAPTVMEDQPFIVQLEHNLLDCLLQMERNPIFIDRAFLKQGLKDLVRWRDQVAAKIYEVAGYDFNLGSPAKVGEFLVKHGVPLPKTAKSKNYATGAEVIEKLAKDHPVCGLITLWRTLDKERGTYAQKLLDSTPENNPYCSFKFKSVGAPTGRFSSGGVEEGETQFADMNAQSIPNSDAYQKARARLIMNPPIQEMDAALRQLGSVQFDEPSEDSEVELELEDLFSLQEP